MLGRKGRWRMKLVRFATVMGCLGCCAMAVVTACSGGTTAPTAATSPPATGAIGDGGSSIDPHANDTTATPPPACANIDAIKIVFAPAYSANDGTNHYRVPAVVAGIDPNLIVWTTSDDTKVTHTPDDSFGGEMFETTGSGEITIFAAAGNLCGHTVLRITQSTLAQWQAGSSRYNNGVVANKGTARPDSSTGKNVACTNCHGASGTLGTVEHTPMQTAGFSDLDLKNIFLKGTTPTGTLAQPISNLTYAQWQGFHTWEVADDAEADGLVTYLRSLTPAPTGNADFGGAFGPGGRRDGGAPRDGGMGEGGAPPGP
jgi:hypothetical protein